MPTPSVPAPVEETSVQPISLVQRVEEALVALGRAFDERTVLELASNLYEDLTQLVGGELSERMSPQQIDEFESYIDAGDEDSATAFLHRELPDYRDVVARHTAALLDQLCGELSELSDEEVVAWTAAMERLRRAAAEGEARGDER